MVEDAVNDDSHSPLMEFFYQLDEQPVTCFQILFSGSSCPVTVRMDIVIFSRIQKPSFIDLNFTDMRINIIVILCVIFMIRW